MSTSDIHSQSPPPPTYGVTYGSPTNINYAIRTSASIAFDTMISKGHKDTCNASKIYFPPKENSPLRPQTTDSYPLSPIQKQMPYHAALMTRTAQRTEPLVPLNCINHTYQTINFNSTNNFIGKIGWGIDKDNLAISPQRILIGSSAGTGISPNTLDNDAYMPHKTWFDKGRNHEFMLDRGGQSVNVDKKLQSMSQTLNGENSQEFFTLATKTMNMLDQRSRKELIKAMQTNQREVSLSTNNGGKWFRVRSIPHNSEAYKNRFTKANEVHADIMSRLTTQASNANLLNSPHLNTLSQNDLPEVVPFVSTQDEGFEPLNYNEAGQNFERATSANIEEAIKMTEPTVQGGIQTFTGTPKQRMSLFKDTSLTQTQKVSFNIVEQRQQIAPKTGKKTVDEDLKGSFGNQSDKRKSISSNLKHRSESTNTLLAKVVGSPYKEAIKNNNGSILSTQKKPPLPKQLKSSFKGEIGEETQIPKIPQDPSSHFQSQHYGSQGFKNSGFGSLKLRYQESLLQSMAVPPQQTIVYDAHQMDNETFQFGNIVGIQRGGTRYMGKVRIPRAMSVEDQTALNLRLTEPTIEQQMQSHTQFFNRINTKDGNNYDVTHELMTGTGPSRPVYTQKKIDYSDKSHLQSSTIKEQYHYSPFGNKQNTLSTSSTIVQMKVAPFIQKDSETLELANTLTSGKTPVQMTREYIRDNYNNHKRYKKISKFKNDGLVYLPSGIQKPTLDFSPDKIPVLYYHDDGKMWKRNDIKSTTSSKKQTLEDNFYFPQSFKSSFKKQKSQKVL